MSYFNLLYDPWIPVVTDRGRQEDKSMVEIFENAQNYKCFAGDMQTQNFAILRMLLAVIQTVFSRYDTDGNVYPMLSVDDMMRQLDDVDEDDYEDYKESLEDCWTSLWEKGCFPDIVTVYLKKWEDHFYLQDKRFPFYQVTMEEMISKLPSNKKPTMVAGRNINRTISESSNKQALFSPIGGNGKRKDKDVMTPSELARWILEFQGYTGLSDKIKLISAEQKPSKGWLFDIGGLYLEGNNIFETLLYNLMLIHPESQYRYNKQCPCWEYSGEDILRKNLIEKPIDNLAELYTNWSRAIYLNPERDLHEPIEIYIAKLAVINHRDAFVEPMTIWNLNKTGEFKGHFSPRKHKPEQAMWRSFGIIAMKTSETEGRKRPGILQQYDEICNVVGNRWIKVNAVSMESDQNATSWVPVDEVIDSLSINDMVLSDSKPDGWVIRINDIVEQTKKIIESIYYGFLSDIADIRNLEGKQRSAFLANNKESAYESIDIPFREWLTEIQPEDSKEEKMLGWKKIVKSLIINQAQNLINQAENRDYTGIISKDHVINLPTAYLTFMRGLNKELL